MSSTYQLQIEEDIVLDMALQGVWRSDTFHPLAPIPFRILVHLALHLNQVIATEQLLAIGWPGEIRDPSDLYHPIHSIRAILEPDPARPLRLVTRKGHGYALVTRDVYDGKYFHKIF